MFHHNYEVRWKMYKKAMKICSNKYQQLNQNHLVTIKTPETIDRNWWWVVHGESYKGITTN